MRRDLTGIIAILTLSFLSISGASGQRMRVPAMEVLDTIHTRLLYTYHWHDPKTKGETHGSTVLNIGKKYSKYESYSDYVADSLMYESRKDGIDVSQAMFILRGVVGVPVPEILTDHTRSDSIRVEDVFVHVSPRSRYQPYYYDEAPKIDWLIGTEFKEIAGIQVRKATARWRGRDWTVWFAESIPCFEGPWELMGAPGLIMVAYDDSGEHEITLDEMRPVNALILDKTEMPGSATTREAYRKYREDFANRDLKDYKAGKRRAAPLTNFIDLE